MDVQSSMSMLMLKSKMEGERRRVNSRPEVHITVQELLLQDSGSISFSTQEFSLQGLRVRALVEIKGTQATIAKELGQEAATRLLKKASSWVPGKKKDKKASSSKSEKATLVGKKGTVEVEDNAAQATGGDDEVLQTCTVELALNVSKEPADDKVHVKIRDLSVGENTFASPATAKKALSNHRIKAMIEAGLAKVMRHSFTKKLKKAKAAHPCRSAIRKLCCCFCKRAEALAQGM
ncbi:unnamed protein product [Prorocentrum cordatum]|uniref:Uncharacterized protein n=1 Tax=Prorocentrum cordatum TaxID=2364126 RepID=A0ABN9UGV0_9DINO|nr:unnamed protein product [Polarella glacialis]